MNIQINQTNPREIHSSQKTMTLPSHARFLFLNLRIAIHTFLQAEAIQHIVATSIYSWITNSTPQNMLLTRISISLKKNKRERI